MTRQLKFTVLILAVLMVSILLTGCGGGSNSATQVNEEEMVTQQVNKWNSAWNEKDTNYFREMFVSENIELTFIYQESATAYFTIQEFINMITDTTEGFGLYWTDDTYQHKLTISNIDVSNGTAQVYSKWYMTNKTDSADKGSIDLYFKLTKGDKWRINVAEFSNPVNHSTPDSLNFLK